MKKIFILLMSLVSLNSTAQNFDKAKLDTLFNRLVSQHKGMGGITLTKYGKTMYARSFGYRQINETSKKLLDENTKYHIGSISKTYTAVMIFQLMEEGKLKRSDHLDKFFPQIPNAARITIAMILNHRSGIPDLSSDEGWRKQSRTHEEVIAAISAGKPLFEPDSKTEYSNTGYVVLSYIVEKIGGKPYAEALQQRICKKIGLNNTYLPTGDNNPERNEALSYRYLSNWEQAQEMHPSIPYGAGAILATTSDMCKFITALFDGKLVSKSSLEQMKTLRDDEGMGLVSFSFAGHILYGFTGGSYMSGAWLAYEPIEKVAMAYATNAKIYKVADIVAGVFDIYWNRPWEIPSFHAPNIDPELLDQYVGSYSLPGVPARMIITKSGSGISISNNGRAIPLEAIATNQFQIGPGVTVSFDTVKKQMTIKRPQGESTFTKEK